MADPLDRPATDGAGPEILVVDDRPRYPLRRPPRGLRAAGFQTREAATGTEGSARAGADAWR